MATVARTLTVPTRYAAELLGILACAVLIALVAFAARLSYRHHGECAVGSTAAMSPVGTLADQHCSQGSPSWRQPLLPLR